MTYKNIFTGGSGEAESAEQSARRLGNRIPGAWPERKGVDPELYDGIPDAPRDPKIVNEFSPGALNIAEDVLTPLFQNFRTTAADQLAASQDPATTSGMASSTEGEVSKNMKADISPDDDPTAANQ